MLSSTIIPGISIAFDNFQNFLIINKRPTVLVIGSGWGSNAFTCNIDKNKYDVKIVSKSQMRLNQPRLISDFNPSYKQLLIDPSIDNCLTVDFDNRIVNGQFGKYNYDYLIIASGSEPNDFGISGVKEYCIMFKTEADLERLQNVLIPDSKVTIIGAGPTGLELAFKLNLMGHQVTIFDASNTILPGFSNEMQKKSMALLEERNISISTNMKIDKITEDKIITHNTPLTRDPIVIWTAGVRPTSFVRDLNNNKPFITSEYLQIKPNVFAIGDIISGRGPPTAQNAKQQGIYLAKYFNNDFLSTKPYDFKEIGRVLDLGDGLLVDYRGYVIKLPSFFRFIFYKLAD